MSVSLMPRVGSYCPRGSNPSCPPPTERARNWSFAEALSNASSFTHWWSSKRSSRNFREDLFELHQWVNDEALLKASANDQFLALSVGGGQLGFDPRGQYEPTLGIKLTLIFTSEESHRL